MADASIVPPIPRAPTNLTAIAIGGRLADFLNAEKTSVLPLDREKRAW